MQDKDKIIKYFKENKLPRPVTINYVGRWALGAQYAVTCGIIRLKRYAVYIQAEEIKSVRQRG